MSRTAVSQEEKPAVILSEASRSDRATQSKDPCILRGSPLHRVPHLRAQFYRALRWVTLSTIVLLFATAAHAQGCTQCLDSTRATPPAVQAAYRHAIYILGGAGAALFLAGLILLRREP